MKANRSFILVAAAAFVLESALFSTLSALLPHYEDELGMSTLASGVLAGTYTGGMIVGTLVAGLWTSDRFGVRSTALVGCGMLAAASIAFGAADDVVALDLARTVQGVGAGLLWCSLLNWLILVVPIARRGTALGSALGAAVFGTAAGPLLGAATQVVGTFAVFAAVALAVLAYAAILARTPSPPPGDEGLPPLERLRLPRDRPLRWLTWIGVLPPLVAGAAIILVPLRLDDLGASEAGIDAALLVGSLLSAACCALAGRVADRRGHWLPIVGGAFICVLTLVAMGTAESAFALAAGFVLFEGIGLSFCWIPLISLFTERGEGVGMSAASAALVLNLTITAAYTIGPPLFTGLAESSAAAVPYLLMAAATLVVLVTTWGRRGFVDARARGVAAGEAPG